MALRGLAIAAATLLALVPAAATAAAPRTSAQIVVYKDAVMNAPAQTRAREHDLGFTARHRYRHALEGFSARLTDKQIAGLRSDPAVAQVLPDRPVHAASTPLVAGGSLPVGLVRTGAFRGGAVREASGVAVAVLDTGIDLDSADLNVASGANCVDAGPPDDDNGHGTHVAGTIGARNDGVDAVGVAPGTQLYSVKVLGTDGSGEESDVICGLDWVTAHADTLGIGVANMSLGGTGPRGTCATDPERAAVCAVTDAGVTVVAAAGNESDAISGGGTSHVPAAYPEALTVTAMSDTDGLAGGLGADCDEDDAPDDSVAPFSNYATGSDIAHTIAAPGECVVSTARGGGVLEMSGTSMASPHVAATAALCIDEGGQPGPCAGMAPAEVIATLLGAAADGATASNGFLGDPFHPIPGEYYGYLLRAGTPPTAASGDADVLGETEASLAGTIDANDGAASWWFELGPSAGTYDVTTDEQTGTPGDDPVPVTGSATGLDPGTTYHYRTVVRVDGWTAHGEDKTFTTPGTPPPPAPDTSIDSNPQVISTSGSAGFTFSDVPAGAAVSFECRLDSPTWGDCDSPFTADSLGDGQHAFAVRGVGPTGKRDATPATFAWTIDREPPQTTISGAPGDPTSNTQATFGLKSSESGSTFECRLDEAPFAACGPVVTLTGLAPGRHSFEARATDAAGLADQSPAFYEWTVLGTTVTTGASTPIAPVGDAPAPANPIAPKSVGPQLVQISRLSAMSPARINRKRSQIMVTVVCRGRGRCAGQLEAAAGRRLALGRVDIPSGARKVVRMTIVRRLRGPLPSRVAVKLTAAGQTAFDRRLLRLVG